MKVPIGYMVIGIVFDRTDEAFACFCQSCLVIKQIAVVVVCCREVTIQAQCFFEFQLGLIEKTQCF